MKNVYTKVFYIADFIYICLILLIWMIPYLSLLDQLNPANHNKTGFKVLDLFAGCGGLGLGFEAAGFETIGMEMDQDACASYNKNLSGKCIHQTLSVKSSFPDCDVIIGGPPCQPFSVGGKQLGLKDSRDGFPIFVKAVEVLQPKVWLFENVRGMAYRNKDYLKEILDKLEQLNYMISIKIINSKKLNVPQNRERLIVVGHKNKFFFPNYCETTYTVYNAIGDIAFEIQKDDIFLTPNQDKYIKKYEIASDCINPRDLHFDQPARTLTCRNLSGATGDMLRIKMPDGRRKRVNIREAARLQSFPDWFSFVGSKSSQLKQIGNSVPPLMSFMLAKSLFKSIKNQ